VGFHSKCHTIGVDLSEHIRGSLVPTCSPFDPIFETTEVFPGFLVRMLDKENASPATECRTEPAVFDCQDGFIQAIGVEKVARVQGLAGVLRHIPGDSFLAAGHPDIDNETVPGDLKPGLGQLLLWHELALCEEMEMDVPGSGVAVVFQFEESDPTFHALPPELQALELAEAVVQAVNCGLQSSRRLPKCERHEPAALLAESLDHIQGDGLRSLSRTHLTKAIVATRPRDAVPGRIFVALEYVGPVAAGLERQDTGD
jgi:hypothetical protein